MGILRWGIITVLAAGTLVATAATFAKAGVPRAEYPRGISLREASVRRGTHAPLFFAGYRSARGSHRSHRGGGMRYGK